jgi:nuclear polyadenylated RNA-binding protein 3
MTSEAPEFHTKTSTPVSPVPLHPAGPSKYPVLENQTDPIFNMTSAHLEVSEKLASPEYSVKQMPESAVTADIGSDVDAEGDIVDDSSFSDAYGEQEENTENTAVKAPEQNTTADDDDDYAMTFESDGELDSNRQDISNETSEPETQSAPAPVSSENPSSAALPATNSAPSITNDGPSLKSPTIPIPPAINGEIFALTESTAAPSSTETAQSQAQTQSTEGAEEKDDEIDIQQLLDNITATAELNASANATPTTASTSSPNFPASSGLSSHSSLPPRPQAVQKPPMHPAYTSQDDIRKYHAGPSSYAPPQLPSYRAPGMPMSIVAAGAPGTSTDPRNMLPPPPTASFNAPPSLNPPPGIAPAPYQQHQRAASQDRPKNAVDSADVDDEGEVQWGPEVQKLYDDFLADERMYVTEGLWDRFPTGSRLFIGKLRFCSHQALPLTRNTGNLPTEKVTKRDLFYVFYKYGRLAQVSIKQAYGFVQFHDVASCYNALDREQGQEVRGRKMRKSKSVARLKLS